MLGIHNFSSWGFFDLIEDFFNLQEDYGVKSRLTLTQLVLWSLHSMLVPTSFSGGVIDHKTSK